MNPKFKLGDYALYIEPNGANTYAGMITSVTWINGQNRYDFECSALSVQRLYSLDDSELLTYQEFQAKLMTASIPSKPYMGSSSIPPAKFQSGDDACYTVPNSTNTIDIVISAVYYINNQVFYDINNSKLSIQVRKVPEDLLMTPTEHMQSQSRSGRSVGVASNLNRGVNIAGMPNPINDYWDSAKSFKASIGPKCVCGAHKVKDSRHSSWCEIKE